MNNSLGKWLFTGILILLGVAWVGGIVWLLHGIGASVPQTQAQPGGTSVASPPPTNVPSKRYHLTLQTFPGTPTDAWMSEHHYQFETAQIPPLDAHPDWVRYGPGTNIVLPAHALVTITIENYDGQSPLLNGFVSHVMGTVDGTMTVNGKTVTSLDPTTVSHTFTIHSIPNHDANQPWLYVSVPVLGEPDAIEEAGTDNGFPPKPEVMEFSFVTGGPGTYVWNCFDPCGWNYNGFGGPMQTRGYMSGTVVVQ
ncbi:MAG: hypothetical protein ACM3N4_02375 [Nitrososphaerota archaeon]